MHQMSPLNPVNPVSPLSPSMQPPPPAQQTCVPKKVLVQYVYQDPITTQKMVVGKGYTTTRLPPPTVDDKHEAKVVGMAFLFFILAMFVALVGGTIISLRRPKPDWVKRGRS